MIEYLKKRVEALTLSLQHCVANHGHVTGMLAEAQNSLLEAKKLAAEAEKLVR